MNDTHPGSRADRFATAESLLADLVRQAWQRGWQPRELVRQIDRSVKPAQPARDLMALAIAAESAQHTTVADPRADRPSDSRWAAQIELITARLPADHEGPGWAARWADLVGSGTATQVCAAVCREVATLGPLLMLVPPPGSTAADVAKWSDLVSWELDANEAADPLLAKVRALLAKAEATEFAEEAEAFTAKAHQLMVTHAIDEAAVRAKLGGPSTVDIGATRCALNEPYAKQHMLLLSAVAGAFDGRCVFHPDWALATVVGSRRVLAQIDALYTSLMVQSQTAFNAASLNTGVGSRERSRGFRSSFLTAYARRVGQRLRLQRDVGRDNAPGDALPVLVADGAAVDAKFDDLFSGSTRSMSVSASDRAGWTAGSAAAERARLSSDELSAEPVRRLSL